MATVNTIRAVQLAPRELYELEDARGTELRVTRGRLWLTLEHDRRDIVLSAGDTFTIDRGGLTLVEAQGEATVCVRTRKSAPPRFRQERAAPGTRLTAWLREFADAGLARGWAPYV